MSALVIITFVLVFPAHVTILQTHSIFAESWSYCVMHVHCVCMCRWVGGGGESPAVFP